MKPSGMQVFLLTVITIVVGAVSSYCLISILHVLTVMCQHSGAIGC